MLGGVIFFGVEAIFVSCSKAARPPLSRPFLAAPRKGKGYTLQAGGVVGGWWIRNSRRRRWLLEIEIDCEPVGMSHIV